MNAWLPAGPVWMFCPADRPERYGTAAAHADVVILDLEDGVAAADKAGARVALRETRLDPERTVVRVNAVGTDDHLLDIRAVAAAGYRRIMLPKCESARQVVALAAWEVVALIETPAGALAVSSIAAASPVIGLMWGAEDLVAALGGTSSRHADGSYRDVVRQLRTMTLFAAKAHGRFALDSVYLDLTDVDGLGAEAADAVAVGFDGKVALHPRQVPVLRAAYTPSDAELARARAILDAVAEHRGVFAFEGKMVDAPVLRLAEQTVRRGLDRK